MKPAWKLSGGLIRRCVARVSVAVGTVAGGVFVLGVAALIASANEPAGHAPAPKDAHAPAAEQPAPAPHADAHAAPPSANAHPAEPVEPTHAEVQARSKVVPGVNPVLLETPDDTANDNLGESKVPTRSEARLQELQIILEMARRFRREKNPAGAVEYFSKILEADAPADMKRTALLEMALMAQQEKQFSRAQMMFNEYVKKYPNDLGVPEVLLRQGLLYRDMGASEIALSKFYSVMTTALALKLDRTDYYKEIVLKAQTEIADTYYLQGKFEEAADFFARLIKLDAPQLNRLGVHYKLIRSLSGLARPAEVIASAAAFLEKYPTAAEQPEIRFLLASAYKKMGRNRDALEQVKLLMESQQARLGQNAAAWVYWQQRAGNEIGNDLYQEGDYVGALTVYIGLAELSSSPAWQFPVLYQIGLVYEKLQQPEKAKAVYQRLAERQKELGDTPSPSLMAVVDMAKWRKNYLTWHAQAEHAAREMTPVGSVKAPALANP